MILLFNAKTKDLLAYGQESSPIWEIFRKDPDFIVTNGIICPVCKQVISGDLPSERRLVR